MNCAEKLFEPTISFNLYTKSPVMFNIKTFSQVLATGFKIFLCSILHFQKYTNSLNGEYIISQNNFLHFVFSNKVQLTNKTKL